MAHLDAFKQLMAEEGLTEEVCLKYGETFDAAMTEAAWKHLKGEYEAFVRDHGKDGEVIRDCRLIEDAKEAEAFTQMKGCLGAVVHPAGQVWPYKFVHALLRLVTGTGKLNVQSHTPATQVSEKDADGWITVTTPRGETRAKAVIHATVREPFLFTKQNPQQTSKTHIEFPSQNAWASHLLPEYSNLIFPSVSTLGALKAPEGFLQNTGAQHWGGDIWNYHLQLPPPYNTIVLGGAKAVITHYPREWLKRGEDDKHLPGVAKYVESWPTNDIVDWPAHMQKGELALPAKEGGVWTGITSPTADAFPFVGAAPDREGHFIAAGFGGHGMPRILLSTAHLTPLVLESLGLKYTAPELVKAYPALPRPFFVSGKRVEALQNVDMAAVYNADIASHEESAKLPFANEERALTWKNKV